jgi:anthranilate synthase component 1
MTTSFDAFAARARLGGAMVPVTRQVVLDGDTPVTAFAKLHRGRYGFLLESLEGGERWARYTFLSTDPREVFRYHGRRCARWTPDAGWHDVATELPPLEHLGSILRRHPPVVVPGLPRFTGGAVGYIGYDVVRTIESLPDAPRDDRDLPDAVLMVTDTLLVMDNLYNRATVIASVEVTASMDEAELRALYAGAEARIDDWLARLAAPGTIRPLTLEPGPALPATTSPYADGQFQDDVRRIKEYIAAGDTFQTVLSRRLELAAPDPFLTYRYLRVLNPAPYLYFLHGDDIHVIGSSPEILVRVEDGEVTLRPIAGTRPRGATPEAPKVRAMQIIDELEPVRRGPYAGAVGYIGWGARNMDTAIAIRTCIMRGGRAWIQAGAGIVADSDPAAEWRETEAKARAVLLALALAGRGAEPPTTPPSLPPSPTPFMSP